MIKEVTGTASRLGQEENLRESDGGKAIRRGNGSRREVKEIEEWHSRMCTRTRRCDSKTTSQINPIFSSESGSAC
jgi:hypothetical protein